MNILEIARLFDFVREAQIEGQNRGQRVEAIAHWCADDLGEGLSWCCYYVTLVLDLFFKGKSPIARQGVVHTVYLQCKANDWLVRTPIPGDLFFYIDDAGHAHHIGFVTGTTPLAGIAGNTSRDGKSSNGDGCYEHTLTVSPAHVRYARIPGVR